MVVLFDFMPIFVLLSKQNGEHRKTQAFIVVVVVVVVIFFPGH